MSTMTESTPERAHQIAVAAVGEGPAADALTEQILELTREIITPYSAALDEVFALRGLAGHTAYALKAHLEYKTFPKSRRAIAQSQVERLTLAAHGNAHGAVAGLNIKPSLRLLGAPTTLTRGAFEESLPQRTAAAQTD